MANDIKVTVKNVDGTSVPLPGNNGKVILYNSSWVAVASQNTSSGVATFTNRSYGTYYAEAYHTPSNPSTIFGEEFWGGAGAFNHNANLTSVSITRSYPFLQETKAYNNSNGQLITGGSIPLGTPVRIEITIKNPGSVSYTVKVRGVIDRNKASSYDFDQTSSSQTISAQSTKTFTLNYTPTATGSFYLVVGTQTQTNGSNYSYTDGSPWNNNVFFSVLEPTITPSTSSLPDFGDVQVNSNSSNKTYTVSGSNLTANLTITAPTHFQVSKSSSSGFGSSVTLTPSGGTISSTTIYVRFSPTSTGSKSGSITHVSSGAATKNVSVSGTGVQPSITTSLSSLPDFGEVKVGTNSSNKTYTVSATYLTENLIITAPSQFQISTSASSGFGSSITLSPSGGSVSSTTIYARFSPTSTGQKSGNISHASTGATTKNISVSGTGVQTGNISVTMKNIDGTSVPLPGSNGNIKRYSQSWQFLDQQNTNSSGIGTFTDKTYGTYNFEGYHNPANPTTIFGVEFWGGSGEVNHGSSTTNVIINRKMPYSDYIKVFIHSTNQDVTGGNIPAGTQLRVEVKAKNPNTVTMNVKPRVVVDINKLAPYDFDQTATAANIPGNNGIGTYTFLYTPSTIGDYFGIVGTLTDIDGNFTYTDGWPWATLSTQKLFTVINPTGTIIVTLKNVDGTSTPIPGGNGNLKRYNQTWQFIDQQNTNSSGVASFGNVAFGTYNFEAYHNPANPSTIFGTEFWGVLANMNHNSLTTNATITRSMPYSMQYKVFNVATGQEVTGGVVAIGTQLRADVTVKNPNSIEMSVKTRVVVDQNKLSPYDFDNTTTAANISGNGTTRTYSINITPLVPGDYYGTVGTQTNVENTFIYTDGWLWNTEKWVTAIQVNSISGTIKKKNWPNNVLSGYVVRATNTSNSNLVYESQPSSDQGNYTITGVPNGTYNLSVLNTIDNNVTFDPSNPVTLNNANVTGRNIFIEGKAVPEVRIEAPTSFTPGQACTVKVYLKNTGASTTSIGGDLSVSFPENPQINVISSQSTGWSNVMPYEPGATIHHVTNGEMQALHKLLVASVNGSFPTGTEKVLTLEIIPSQSLSTFDIRYRGILFDRYDPISNIDPNTTDQQGWPAKVKRLTSNLPTTFGITVLVHGYNIGGDKKANPDDFNPITDTWEKNNRQIISGILKRMGGGKVYLYNKSNAKFEDVTSFYPAFQQWDQPDKEKILVFNWGIASNDVVYGHAEAAAEALFVGLVNSLDYSNIPFLIPTAASSNRSFHFIGHSRGTVVVSECIQRMGVFNVPVSYVTYLDPHDYDEDDITMDELFNDPAVQIWENVKYAENFYQISVSNFPLPNPSGREIEQLIINSSHYNRNLSSLSNFNSNDSHGKVIDYYSGTINTGLMSESWYVAVGGAQSTGFSLWLGRGGHDYDGSVNGFNPNKPRTNPQNYNNLVPYYSPNELGIDNNYASPVLFNGDFDHGIQQYFNPLYGGDLSGWSYFGGEGEGHVELNSNNNHLELDYSLSGNQRFRTHNWFYVPNTAEQLEFWYKVNIPSSGTPPNTDKLRVTIMEPNGNNAIVLDNIYLNQTSVWTWKSINITSFRNKIIKVKFEIIDAGLVDAEVWIDNITLKVPAINTFPLVPFAVSPLDSVLIQTLTPSFEWSQFQHGGDGNTQAGYQVRVRDDADNDRIVYETGFIAATSGNSHQYSPGAFTGIDPVTNEQRISEPLKWGRLYHWHIRYRDNSGDWSGWSHDDPNPHQEFLTASGSITVSSSTVPDFGHVQVGQNSEIKSYQLSAMYLNQSLSVEAPLGFEISMSSLGPWQNQLTISPVNGVIQNTMIFVRFTPAAVQVYTGNIRHSSEGAQDVNVGVTGTGNSMSIELTSPNGGENWQAGTQNPITWSFTVITPAGKSKEKKFDKGETEQIKKSSQNLKGGNNNYDENGVEVITNIKLQYSTNNGSSWITIKNSYPGSNGSYNWTIPNTPSLECKVKISDAENSSVSDESNGLFIISMPPQPVITVASPDGGENWVTGTTQNISWISSDVENVKIEYSADGGNNWTNIINSTPASIGSYQWEIPNTPSTQCKVKISDVVNVSITDQSNNVFTISAAPNPAVSLTSPNGNENWIIGTLKNITWTSQDINFLKLEYTTNNGSDWVIITESTAASEGNYQWLVPNTPSAQCKVKISDASNSSISDVSDNMFAILQQLPPHFQTIWTGNPYLPMNIYITSASLQGLPLEAGDEIAVFDGNNCVGVTTITGVFTTDDPLSIVCSADDPTTPGSDGFMNGNVISYKFWKAGLQQEVSNISASYASGNGTFSTLGSAVCGLTGELTVTQVIQLSAGWNIFSLNVVPQNTNMLQLIQPLIDQQLLVKLVDERGFAIENIPGVGWLNNIGNWAATEGYYIKVSSSCTLSVTGIPVQLPFNIPLISGWNIFSYPVNTEGSSATILGELITTGKLIKVLNQSGSAIEFIPGIGWINNIGNLVPGQGYYIKVNTDCMLIMSPALSSKPNVLLNSRNIK